MLASRIKPALPLCSNDMNPFHVNAELITAGQNGATFSDQSAALISCHYQTQTMSSHIYRLGLADKLILIPNGTMHMETYILK